MFGDRKEMQNETDAAPFASSIVNKELRAIPEQAP